MAEHESYDRELEVLVGQALDQDDREPLSDDEIATLLTGDSAELDALTDEDREALVDRLSADRQAVEKMQALRPLESWSRSVAQALPASAARARGRRPGRRLARRWTQGLALAATVLLALGWTLLMPRQEVPASDSTFRAAPSRQVGYDPADGSRLTVAPEHFRWTLPDSVDAGDTIRVLLFDDNAELLWESPVVSGGEVSVPPELRSRLERGGIFFWRLSIDDGLETRRTFLAQFEIRP